MQQITELRPEFICLGKQPRHIAGNSNIRIYFNSLPFSNIIGLLREVGVFHHAGTAGGERLNADELPDYIITFESRAQAPGDEDQRASYIVRCNPLDPASAMQQLHFNIKVSPGERPYGLFTYGNVER